MSLSNSRRRRGSWHQKDKDKGEVVYSLDQSEKKAFESSHILRLYVSLR